jgi:chemotaxis protein MotA
MFILIGIVVVIASIAGGYLLEHGSIRVLLQPAELLIIGGSALGTLFVANPLHVLVSIGKGLVEAVKGSHYTRAFYLENLKMLYDLFVYARKHGVARLEADIDEPEKSPVFQKYPKFLTDQTSLDFVCDTIRMSISGGVPPLELDQLMELDLEVQHLDNSTPPSALTTVADSLPGLGIVAAVLGVVITMGALGGPPEEIGQKVAAALVGTFLGVLLCYGFVGPLASAMAKHNGEHSAYLQVLRLGVLAYLKGMAPVLAVEFARRGIPTRIRPSFRDMETTVKSGSATAAKAA